MVNQQYFLPVGHPDKTTRARRATITSNNQINQAGYLDPSRTVESYNASLGHSADLNAFLAEARLQSKDNWNPQLTADAVNNYIREGFGASK